MVSSAGRGGGAGVGISGTRLVVSAETMLANTHAAITVLRFTPVG